MVESQNSQSTVAVAFGHSKTIAEAPGASSQSTEYHDWEVTHQKDARDVVDRLVSVLLVEPDRLDLVQLSTNCVPDASAREAASAALADGSERPIRPRDRFETAIIEPSSQ
jgi:hypothetical protein